MEIDVNALSPMMKHYLQIKSNYPDTVLMYRLGDFYEMFFDDAVTVSRELELTLTGRDCGLKERAPMCGVPYHAVDTYISRLINKGYKVAICEQLTAPGDQKGMLERDVIRVITAGTVVEDTILDDKQNNYIASVYWCDKGYGVAYADLSTGEFKVFESQGEQAKVEAESLLNGLHPSEILCNSAGKDSIDPEAIYRLKVNTYYDYAYAYDNAYKLLCKQLQVVTLQAFECDDCKLGICAGGALMAYLNETQKRTLSHICRIAKVGEHDYMFFDTATRRNLELTETILDRRKTGTLLWLLDSTSTSMGARGLRRWIDQPLLDEKAINDRLNAVDELIKNTRMRTDVQRALGCIRDLERLAGKVAYGSVTPRDMLGIGDSLIVLPVLKKCLDKAKSPLLVSLRERILLFEKETELLSHAIAPDPPHLMADGGYIADGFNAQLDELRHAKAEAGRWIAELQERERQATGIKNLKVGNNHVFGYYIEVTKLNLDAVPAHYMRKQTLANGERFKTDELIDLENKIFGSHEKAIVLEAAIFAQLKQTLLAIVPDLLSTAAAVAELDCLESFAIVSLANKYVKPTIGAKVDRIEIVNGRHPVVEKLVGAGKFTANDTLLDKDCRTMVITGPNMAGKSTYMRQVALITLMAHLGCFVPADKAAIALTDRIFTRVGASDDLAGAQSTFMVEMLEVANIAHNATARSLVIMDEIGRGTSTIDGLSIAWAVMEYINNIVGAKTLFATHYHELTQLEGRLEGVKNYRVLVNEAGDTVVFLHRIARGGTNKSFGIEVASLAGVPKTVCDRAKDLAKQLENHASFDTNMALLDTMGGAKQEQMSMFETEDTHTKEIIRILQETAIERLTPVQAMVVLADLVERANNG